MFRWLHVVFHDLFFLRLLRVVFHDLLLIVVESIERHTGQSISKKTFCESNEAASRGSS